MEVTSDGLALATYLAEPTRPTFSGYPGLVLVHGFPTRAPGGRRPEHAYHDLADRVAADLGWVVLAVTLRGCGESEGNFSLPGWTADVGNAVAALHARPDIRSVFVVGFGTGGALCLCAAADDPLIAGVAAVSPPADFNDWRADVAGLLGYARQVGAIRDADYPADVEAWAAELATLRPVDAAARLAPRPLLVVHGADDDVVPTFDARAIADAHTGADLRIIAGAGHRLRFDPRAIAILLGWLDRNA